jgi:hypothetical protein
MENHMAAKERTEHSLDAHRDPHPMGIGIGAAGGAVAGAAFGIAGGPAGALVGGVIGAVAGGLAGSGLAEVANPAAGDGQYDLELGQGGAHAVDHDRQDAYWREAHSREPYYNPERNYDDYSPAYRLGWESRAKYDGGTYDRYEPAFRNDWDTVKGDSRLTWDEAKHATRAGWHRMEQSLPGDADGDGR